MNISELEAFAKTPEGNDSVTVDSAELLNLISELRKYKKTAATWQGYYNKLKNIHEQFKIDNPVKRDPDKVYI